MAHAATQSLTASQEDYLEAILDLMRETGEARVCDIAARLRVGKSSVTVALRALARRRLVNHRPYRMSTLTEAGQREAERIRRRHTALGAFFRDVLDVEKGVAEASACRLEHAMADGIMRRLSCFVAFLSASSVPACQLPRAFREECERRRGSAACNGCKSAGRAGAPPRRRRAGGGAP